MSELLAQINCTLWGSNDPFKEESTVDKSPGKILQWKLKTEHSLLRFDIALCRDSLNVNLPSCKYRTEISQEGCGL